MSCYVIGVATHPPASANRSLRLEEMAFQTATAALAEAGITRGQIDSVTLGACDELDGRSISSMLMAMPAGAYLQDEIRVTDSGATALCLAVARLLTGECDVGMVASWCKSSKSDVEAVMRFRAEPFYSRPIGLNMAVTDALFAQAVLDEHGIDEDEIDERVVAAYRCAAGNPRGMRYAVPSASAVAGSDYVATPLRTLQRAPLTDGAVSMVIASGRWLRAHPEHEPLARIAGVGWASDSYRLDAARLRGMNSLKVAWTNAARMAAISSPDECQVIELESQTGYHEAAFTRALGIRAGTRVSPSGGPFAQNPLFCTGLIGAAEAVLQVADRAGPVQVDGVTRAAAQSCHGYAQQGNVVMIFEKAGAIA